jgi:hypothetical protein
MVSAGNWQTLGGRKKSGPMPCLVPESVAWQVSMSQRITPLRLPPRRPSTSRQRAALMRDGYGCVCCGASVLNRPYSVGYRKRDVRGSSDSMTNLLTFLGHGVNAQDPLDHYARIRSRCSPRDEDHGYTVRSTDDPALVPVMVTSPGRLSAGLWLAADGTYSAESPEMIS